MRTPRTLRLFGILLALFVIVNIGNALHKGGDFADFLEGGRRFLTGTRLYEGSLPGLGVIGPPFQSLCFAPFALLAGLHAGVAAVLWYLINVVCLLAGIWCWTQAILPGRLSSARELWSAPEVLWPFTAIALPAQTNFEHQNMSALLLFLTGAGALALVRNASTRASAFFGVAVALKIFPALLLGALFIRRFWKTALWGGCFALGLSLAAASRYGVRGAVDTFHDWLQISVMGGWPTRPQNQSLFAALSRVFPDAAATAYPVAWLILAGLVAVVAWNRRFLPSARVGRDLAFGLAVAVVLSPIAWEHYWILIFPILQATYAAGSKQTPFRRAAFWIAAALITGPSPLIVGPLGYDLARAWASSTIAALLLIGVLTPALFQEVELARRAEERV